MICGWRLKMETIDKLTFDKFTHLFNVLNDRKLGSYLNLTQNGIYRLKKKKTKILKYAAKIDCLYEKYKHFGTNNADIFMEATRHIMSEVSGLPLNDNECYERKLDYLCKIKGKIIKST
jgi:hypothetical protein